MKVISHPRSFALLLITLWRPTAVYSQGADGDECPSQNEPCDNGLPCALAEKSSDAPLVCCDVTGEKEFVHMQYVCTGLPDGANCGNDGGASDTICRNNICAQGTCRDEKQADGELCGKYSWEANDDHCLGGKCALENASEDARMICCASGKDQYVHFGKRVCTNLAEGSYCGKDGGNSDATCASGNCGQAGYCMAPPTPLPTPFPTGLTNVESALTQNPSSTRPPTKMPVIAQATLLPTPVTLAPQEDQQELLPTRQPTQMPVTAPATLLPTPVTLAPQEDQQELLPTRQPNQMPVIAPTAPLPRTPLPTRPPTQMPVTTAPPTQTDSLPTLSNESTTGNNGDSNDSMMTTIVGSVIGGIFLVLATVLAVRCNRK